MTDDDRKRLEHRVLVLAPTSRDAAMTSYVLEGANIPSYCCSNVEQLREQLEFGASAVVLAEEAVTDDPKDRLVDWLAHQPPWSDLPVLVISRPGADSVAVAQAMDLLGNVTVLERPTRIAALVSAVRTAVRARMRQYQTRQHLTDLEHSEQESQRAAYRLRLLWEAAEVLLTAEDPDTMLRRLFANIRQHLEIDTYFNFMVDESGDVLRLASYSGISAEDASKIERLEFGQAICGNVAIHRHPIVATSIQQSDDPNVQLVKSCGIRVYACNPLMAGDQLLGTLSFASRTRDEFLARELEVIQIICRYVAAAYERLHLIRRLRDADRRKDEFLAVLAHELRNPLAPIRNSLHILRLNRQLDTATMRVVEMMERQLNHLIRLVDDLLEVSRITRGKIELRKENVELAAIVRSAVETSRPLIEAAGHELTLFIPPQPLTVDGDPVRLAQVIANLLNNAAKYTDEGGQITLAVRRDGDFVNISIRDSGMGIPAEMLPRVFELFTQVELVSGRAQGGLGIGLTLVKSLVEMHGGTVQAYSDGPGEGSEFVVRLPLLASGVPANRLEGLPSNVLTPRRVLVVDDNHDAAQSLGTLLQLLGAEVQVAYSGADALAVLDSYQPDVVLLDLGMPNIDGYEVAKQIRQRSEFQNMTLIALTGWGQEEARQRTELAGFDHHLIKPADVSALQTLFVSLKRRPGL